MVIFSFAVFGTDQYDLPPPTTIQIQIQIQIILLHYNVLLGWYNFITPRPSYFR